MGTNTTTTLSCENSFVVAKGKVKGNYSFTVSGAIKYKETVIKTLKGEELKNTSELNISVSPTQRYAYILIIDQYYGGERWLLLNTETRRLIIDSATTPDASMTAQPNVIWSDYREEGYEKYLIIPEAGEGQSCYLAYNFDANRLTIFCPQIDGLTDCELPLLTNKYSWFGEDKVAIIIEIPLNPWWEGGDVVCDVTKEIEPVFVIFDLEESTYRIRK